MKKKIVSLALVGAMVASMAACGGAPAAPAAPADGSAPQEAAKEEAAPAASGETYNWQIGNVLSADQPWDMGLVKFAELMNEYSDGRINATVQSGGVLGSEVEMLEAVQMGTLEMSIASTPSYSGFTNVLNYFDLPYLFQSTESAWAVMDEWLAQDRIDALEGSGFKCLGFYDNGEYMIGSNIEILHPEQAAGLRVRAHSSQLQCDSLAAVGANPLSVAWGDIYTSLQNGTIDAVSGTTLTNMYGGKFYEQCKYIYMTKHHFIPAPVSINEDLWNSLSAEDQEIVQKAFNDSVGYQREQAAAYVTDAKANIEASGCEVVDVDAAEWAAATASVYEKWVTEENGMNQEMIDKIQASDAEHLK